jgi:hypothetical protein
MQDVAKEPLSGDNLFGMYVGSTLPGVEILRKKHPSISTAVVSLCYCGSGKVKRRGPKPGGLANESSLGAGVLAVGALIRPEENSRKLSII